MNLHQIVGPIVAAVNPWQSAQYKRSTGYATGADGKRTPAYATATDVQVQMQALQYKDLIQVNGLNLNGEKRAMYCMGQVSGVMRPDGTGGDLFVLPDNTVWLVVVMLENWNTTAGWTKVAVVKQNGG